MDFFVAPALQVGILGIWFHLFEVIKMLEAEINAKQMSWLINYFYFLS